MTEPALMAAFPPAEAQQVTLENWRVPPYNRWAFQHVRELISTANIWRGSGPIWQFDREPTDLTGIGFTDHTGGANDVGHFLGATQADGVVVLHRGRIVTERYFGGFTEHRPHILMSVSKSLTATLAGMFVARGLLDPKEPVIGFMPELKGSAFADCTLQHILDMTVGADFDEDYLANAGAITQYREVSGWKPPSPENADGDLRSWLPSVKKKGEHGAAFHYVSPCTDLLGWILERIGGRPFHAMFSDMIWQPMGAEFDAYVTVDRLGAQRTAGGICVTLRDLARFGQMLLEGGHANGRQIVPGAWIDDTVTNFDRAAWAAGESADYLPTGGYRNKWWIIGNDHGAYTGIGVFGQWLYIDPAASVVVAVFSSQPLPTDDNVSIDSVRCFDAICRALGG